MRIEVYPKRNKKKPIYEADAVQDFNIQVSNFNEFQRKSISFETRLNTSAAASSVFVIEVQKKLALLKIRDYRIFVIFSSNQSVWNKSESDIEVGSYPGKKEKKRG